MWIQLFKILLNLLQHCTVYCIDVQIEEPYLTMTPGGECKECQHTVNHCIAPPAGACVRAVSCQLGHIFTDPTYRPSSAI